MSGSDPALAIPHSFRVGMHPGCLICIQKQAKLCRGMIATASCLPAAVPEFADWTDSIARDSMNRDAVIASVGLEIWSFA